MPKIQNLLSAPPQPNSTLPVPVELYWSDANASEPERERSAVPLGHYLWVLRRHMWRIAGLVLTAVVCVYVLTKRITPIYESTVTIGIDRQMPTGVVGQDSTRALANDSDQFLLTQLKLLQSDSVIRPVVEQFHLARDAQASESRIALPGLSVTRVPGTYLLLASYRSPDPHLSANVANALAKSYGDYTYDIRFHATANQSAFMERQLEELKAKTERSAAALAKFEQDLSMINPEQKTSIISARLLQLNTDYGTAEGDRVAKESAWRSVQSGTVESLQVSAQGAALQPLIDRIAEAKQKLADLATHLGPRHPDCLKASQQIATLEKDFEAARLNISRRVETEYRQALAREDMLRNEFQATKAEFDLLNSRSFQYTALKREADTDRALYDELERKIKEAGINAGFQNNSINISDPARPNFTPVYPNTRSNLIEAFLLSLVTGVIAAILSDKIDNTIRDPEQARSFLGTEVVASLPLVRSWKGKLVPAGTPGSAGPIRRTLRRGRSHLARLHPARQRANPAQERNGHQRRALRRQNHHRRPTGHRSRPAEQQNAAHRLRPRRPGIHTKLGLQPQTGLAAALREGLAWRDKLIRIDNIPNLTVLPAGPSFEGADSLIGASLKNILAAAEAEFDLVIVDSPPVLGFSEPLQMAAAAGGVIVVTVAGATDRHAVSQVLASLRRLRVNLLGLILNEVSPSNTDGYYDERYCRRYYKYYRRESKARGA
jgi:polysaccharide biosynthesis transport protein